MSAFHLPTRLHRALRLPGAAAVLAGALALTGACGNYQLALQGTATPAAGGALALGVRQLPPGSPQPVVGDPAALATAAQVTAPGAIALQPAAPAQAGAPAPAAAAPALAVAAPARPAIGDQPGSSAAAAAPALPTATTVTTATATATARAANAPRAATPMPSYTAPAAPRATAAAPPSPSPAPSPSPSPAPARPATVQVYLPEGTSDFMYAGRTMPADQALAALTGQFSVIYFKPAGATEPVAYRPGIDPVPTLPHNTLVRIGMKRAMSFVMQVPQ